MKFHHVGVACRNIEEEIEKISRIHSIATQTPILFDPLQDAQLCLLTLADGVNIELVSGKQVELFVKKGINYYHLCFEVDDLDAEVARLEEEGAHLISPPKPAILFNNRRVAFLRASYGIVELLASDL